jgi:hypothetical protein
MATLQRVCRQDEGLLPAADTATNATQAVAQRNARFGDCPIDDPRGKPTEERPRRA